MAQVLFVDPLGQKALSTWIVVEHRPADATGKGDSLESGHEGIDAAPCLADCLGEGTVCGEGFWTSFESTKVIFVVSHTIEFKRESALELSEGIGICLRILGIFLNLAQDHIGLFYVPLIELDMGLKCLRGDAGNLRKGELTG